MRCLEENAVVPCSRTVVTSVACLYALYGLQPRAIAYGYRTDRQFHHSVAAYKLHYSSTGQASSDSIHDSLRRAG